MSLLFYFFEALRLASVTSFLFLFTILGPAHAVHCGQQSCISSFISWQSLPQQIQILRRFDGVVECFYICRAMNVLTTVCNWLHFVLAETSATDIQGIAQHFLHFQQRIFLQFLGGIQQAMLFTMTALDCQICVFCCLSSWQKWQPMCLLCHILKFRG